MEEPCSTTPTPTSWGSNQPLFGHKSDALTSRLRLVNVSQSGTKVQSKQPHEMMSLNLQKSFDFNVYLFHLNEVFQSALSDSTKYNKKC